MSAPNAAQRAAWNGDSGGFWAAHLDSFESGVAGYRERFVAAAAVRPGENVLDVGCGAGATTLDAAAAAGPGGAAHGIDLSEALLSIARERARSAGLTRASFAVADAQTDDVGVASVDVVLSRNGVMFFDDPAAAFANLHRALHPGGRMVLQVWQPLAEQEWLWSVNAALGLPDPPTGDGPGPLSLGDPNRVRALLSGAGFTELRVDDVRGPMWFGRDVDEAAAFHLAGAEPHLAQRPEPDRRQARDALRQVLAAHAGPDGVTFPSAAWLVRARRG